MENPKCISRCEGFGREDLSFVLGVQHYSDKDKDMLWTGIKQLNEVTGSKHGDVAQRAMIVEYLIIA
jgi:hypothetical protein